MTVCKPWNCTSNLFYHNLPISFTLHQGLGYGSKPKGKGINSNAKIQKLEEHLKEKDTEIDKLLDKVDYLTSHLENQERVLDDRLANQEKIWEARFERQQMMFDMFLSTNGHPPTHFS